MRCRVVKRRTTVVHTSDELAALVDGGAEEDNEQGPKCNPTIYSASVVPRVRTVARQPFAASEPSIIMSSCTPRSWGHRRTVQTTSSAQCAVHAYVLALALALLLVVVSTRLVPHYRLQHRRRGMLLLTVVLGACVSPSLSISLPLRHSSPNYCCLCLSPLPVERNGRVHGRERLVVLLGRIWLNGLPERSGRAPGHKVA